MDVPSVLIMQALASGRLRFAMSAGGSRNIKAFGGRRSTAGYSNSSKWNLERVEIIIDDPFEGEICIPLIIDARFIVLAMLDD